MPRKIHTIIAQLVLLRLMRFIHINIGLHVLGGSMLISPKHTLAYVKSIRDEKISEKSWSTQSGPIRWSALNWSRRDGDMARLYLCSFSSSIRYHFVVVN